MIMKGAQNKAAALLYIAISMSMMMVFLSSCQIKEIFSNSDMITTSSLTETSKGQNINGVVDAESSVSDSETESRLVFFDYKEIKLDVTTSIGANIKNCNLV